MEHRGQRGRTQGWLSTSGAAAPFFTSKQIQAHHICHAGLRHSVQTEWGWTVPVATLGGVGHRGL